MAPITILTGMVLIALGLYGYFASETQAPTALIPAAFGIVLLLLGALALQDKMRKHAMHAAAMFGVIGLLGAGVMAVKAVFSDNITNPLAARMQALMSLTCAIFIGLCFRSFIAARKRRQAGNEQSPGSK